MKIKIIAVLIVLIAAFSGVYILLHHHDPGIGSADKELYTCPMHPQIVQDKPGDCPICGMKLVPVKKEEKRKSDTQKTVLYRSTMNPGETSDVPAKDSMGMDMAPYEVKTGDRADEPSTPQGLAAVSIPQDKRRMMGLSFEKVVKRNLSREIRTQVRIVPDETRQFKVTTKVSGWVEKLFINQTGQFVKKGSPLLNIYSQELLSAQQEYISAIRAVEKLSSGDASASSGLDEIETAARERLAFFDISPAQIERLKTTKSAERSMTLYAPSSGYVSEKMVLPGQKIMMNDSLMVITDLSQVWGEIDIYEADLPYIKTGMPAEITLPYWDGKVFRGRVNFVNPFMEAETRTVKARVEIPNSGVLKPNMYGNAKLLYSVGSKIAVPENAVMRTGVRAYVFIEGKGDLVVPYEISLGTRSGDGYFEVIKGLKGGERVVSSANFLVDSESSLKAAFNESAGGK